MKVFTQHNMMILDLILVSLFGLSVWHTSMTQFIMFSLVLLRLFATFSLQDKKKANWLPIAIYSVWMILIATVDNGNLLENTIVNPTLRMVKVFLAFIGCSELGLVDNFRELDMEMETNQMAAITILTLLLSVFYYFWLLFYPIIEYIRQWKKNELIDRKWLNGSLGLIITYVAVVVILMHITDSVNRLVVLDRYNIFLFFMSGLPLIMYLKERKPLSHTFKVYAVIVAIFYCAYVIGGQLLYYPSLIGLLLLPSIFYYCVCRFRGVQMQYMDWCVLIVAEMSFWMAQHGCNWLRVLLLSISAIAYGYEVYQFLKRGQSKKLSVALFVVIAFILPTITIGYNQYTVLNARIERKYTEYNYACNGVLRIYNPKTGKCGLRDRYGEILPCRYDAVVHMSSQYKPFVKVLQNGLWGICDIEKNRLIIEPEFVKIEPYSTNHHRLVYKSGGISYFQSNPYYYSGYDDSDLWRIVEHPNEDLLKERVEPISRYLNEKDVENKPQIERIYVYIMSTYFDTEDAEYRKTAYWEWARKCTNLIESIAKENYIFIADTARVTEQAVVRVNEMLRGNSCGNQSEMNCYSFVRAVTEFYLAIDNNQVLEKMAGLQWDNGLEEEYGLWMDFLCKSYELYEDIIWKDENYTALPMDLNSELLHNSKWRTNILKENINLFKNNEPIIFNGKDVTDNELNFYLNKMDNDKEETCFINELRATMFKWLHHRDNMANYMAPEFRNSFINQTKRIRYDLSNILKKWSEDFDSYKELCAIRAQIDEEAN